MRWPMPRRSVSQFAPITGRRGRGAIGHEKVRTWWGTFLEAGHDWKTKKKDTLIIKDVDKVDKFLDQEAHFLETTQLKSELQY